MPRPATRLATRVRTMARRLDDWTLYACTPRPPLTRR